MAEIRLPRWIITNKCLPAGHRTAKKPVLVVPVEAWAHRNPYVPQGLPEVFEPWEYRFWAMALLDNAPAAALIECRACGSLQGHTRQARVFHHAQGKCTSKLCEAYKLLLKDERCLICDAKTGQTKYGVPLCSSACVQAWCEAEPQPKALMNALLLVGGF